MVMVMYVFVRTGRVITLSAARFAVVTTAVLAQYNPAPQVARELCELLAQRHGLFEIGQKIADRRPSAHRALLPLLALSVPLQSLVVFISFSWLPTENCAKVSEALVA